MEDLSVTLRKQQTRQSSSKFWSWLFLRVEWRERPSFRADFWRPDGGLPLSSGSFCCGFYTEYTNELYQQGEWVCLTWAYSSETRASSAISVSNCEAETAKARCASERAIRHKPGVPRHTSLPLCSLCPAVRSLTLAARLKNKYSGCRKSLTEYFKLVVLERDSLKIQLNFWKLYPVEI
jgi:hypothetical protein